MIVDNYAKVDFHIHSFASKTKKGDIIKTKNNTFENIDVLFKRMNNSKINMFSFTDHNTFDYNLFKNTKEYIVSENFEYSHIQAILPGVEFDLDFDSKNTRTHAVCIFNDEDNEKLKGIDKIIKTEVGEQKYNEVKFKEDELNRILQQINLDFILIVHQRSDIQNEDVNGDNDFSKLGNEVKDRLMYCDYFTLYESNQHLFRFRFEDLKKRMEYSSNFITGSDCHTWSKYPDLTEGDFDFTYIKTDFSFTGLKIAVTGNGERRILKNLPISIDKIYDSITYTVNDIEKKIPMSNGINAVIGGNTSGKSLMLAKLFNELDPNKKGEDFLDKWSLSFVVPDIESSKVEFTKQGDVRKMFEDGGTGLVNKFHNLFSSIDYSTYFKNINGIAKLVLDVAKINSRKKELSKSLDCIINIPNYDDVTYYPLVSPLPLRPTNPTKGIDSRFSKIFTVIDELYEMIDNNDKATITKAKALLDLLKNKYKTRNDHERMRISVFESFISAKDDYLNYIQDKSTTVTDLELMQYDKIVTDFLNDMDEMIEMKISDKMDINKFIEEFDIPPVSNQKGDLSYVTSPKVQIYTRSIQEKILMSPFKNNNDFTFKSDINKLDIEYIINYLRRNATESIDKLNYYQKYLALLDSELRKTYFNDTFKVLEKDEPIQDTKSPGNNAIYYIKTKSETMNNKLVIFDQPEDDVAPEKIRTDLIKSLSKLAVSNQVILVTHNPQLVVNLDVDNVICMDDSGENFVIHHGPLYLKGETDILDIVANKLDGGKKALKERWRRYE